MFIVHLNTGEVNMDPALWSKIVLEVLEFEAQTYVNGDRKLNI